MQPDQLTLVGGQGTPSPLSPTPSPAGSVGSVGSQSSGYSSGELAGVRNGSSGTSLPQQPPVAAMGPCMPVPIPVHTAIQKQNAHFGYVLSCFDLWEQADQLVTKGRHTGKLII